MDITERELDERFQRHCWVEDRVKEAMGERWSDNLYPDTIDRAKTSESFEQWSACERERHLHLCCGECERHIYEPRGSCFKEGRHLCPACAAKHPEYETGDQFVERRIEAASLWRQFGHEYDHIKESQMYLSFVGKFNQSDSEWWGNISQEADQMVNDWSDDKIDDMGGWEQATKQARLIAIDRYLDTHQCKETDRKTKDFLTVTVYQDGEWSVILSVCQTARLDWVEWARVKQESFASGPVVAPGCEVVPHTLVQNYLES